MHAAPPSALFSQGMPWVMSTYAGNLEVDLRPGVESTEWEPLMNGILKQRSTLELVTFLVPDGFEAGSQAQFLNSIEQTIVSQGIDVLRVPA
jgi:hypothetical protein